MHHVRIPASALMLALPLLVQPSHFGLPESMLWIAPGAIWLGLEIGHLIGQRRNTLGWQAGIEAACMLLDRQRQEVVDNDQDPTWTEHFLAVEQKLRALECAPRDLAAKLQAQISVLTEEVTALKLRLQEVGTENTNLVNEYRRLRKAHSKGLKNGRDRTGVGA